MGLFQNEPAFTVVIIFFVLIAVAYRYAMSLVRNNRPALDQINYQLLSMEFIAIHENGSTLTIELHGKKHKTGEQVIIHHPIPDRVWKNIENKNQAVLDQYGLENNPLVDVRIETDDSEKYIVVDGRF